MQVSARSPSATCLSPLAQLVASPATLASWATWPPTRFAAIAGVAKVLARRPIRGDLQAHLALARVAEQPPASTPDGTSRERPKRTSADCYIRDGAPPRPWSPDCCNRTIWAAPPLRAARALWSESGGRGGVSDLGAASRPPPKRAPRRRRRRRRPGRGMSPFALAGPAMPDGTRAIEGHPRPHARACVRRPSARPEDVPRSG
jgi:hypothetical protein